MALFTSLPAEIQQDIIHVVIDTYPGQAGACAAVSSTWQVHVEMQNFKTLYLDQDRLEAARTILTSTRWNYVRNIKMKALIFRGLRDDKQHTLVEAFTQTIIDLFATLACWNYPIASSHIRSRGITLDLHACSPFDLQGNPISARRRSNKAAHVRLTDGIYHKLPVIPFITTFNVSSCPTERLLTAQTCAEIASRMSNVVTIEWNTSDYMHSMRSVQVIRREKFAMALDELPQSLRYFTLRYGSHKTTDDRYDMRKHARLYYESERTRLGLSLADKAENSSSAVTNVTGKWPDSLSASLNNLSKKLFTMKLDDNIIIEETLFWPDMPVLTTVESLCWPCLKMMKIDASPLTPSGEWLFDNHTQIRQGRWPSRIFRRTRPIPGPLNRFCLAAARAAANMPELTCLDVRWDREQSCMMQYNVQDGEASARLFFGSIPVFDMSGEVKDAWRTAAKTHIGDFKELEIVLETTDGVYEV